MLRSALLLLLLSSLAGYAQGYSAGKSQPVLQAIFNSTQSNYSAGDTLWWSVAIPAGWQLVSHQPQEDVFSPLEATLQLQSVSCGPAILPQPEV